MRDVLLRASISLFCKRGEPWVLLDEHQIHSRIPDLVLARIDTEALSDRIKGGWDRALSPTELRALRALRPDRGRSLTSAANEMRVGQDRARETLHRLVADTFVERTASGSYARRAPVRPVVDRVVMIEAKRSDLSRAFRQARAHSAFADVSVVAFDLAYKHRAERCHELYARQKIGLLGLSAADGSWDYMLPGRRSPLIVALGRALTGERTLARLRGQVVRRLPQTRLPGGSPASDYPAVPVIVGSVPRGLLRSLPACVRPPRGLLPA
jgi:hypothetical protein